jgi:LemA protein
VQAEGELPGPAITVPAVTEIVSPSGARSRPGWLIPLIVVAAIILIVILPLISSYNGLVNKRNAVNQSFADLDTQLQRRNDLIPNLVNSVKGALNQEQAVFGELADARTRYAGATTDDQKIAAANQTEGALGRLLVIVESYPQLQSNQNIQNLMTQLEGTENRIAQARRDYNGVTTAYNTSIQHFPRSVVAGMFGFHSRTLYKAQPQATTPPTVEFNNGPTTTLAR